MSFLDKLGLSRPEISKNTRRREVLEVLTLNHERLIEAEDGTPGEVPQPWALDKSRRKMPDEPLPKKIYDPITLRRIDSDKPVPWEKPKQTKQKISIKAL